MPTQQKPGFGYAVIPNAVSIVQDEIRLADVDPPAMPITSGANDKNPQRDAIPRLPSNLRPNTNLRAINSQKRRGVFAGR
jgi:hypothetical protein